MARYTADGIRLKSARSGWGSWGQIYEVFLGFFSRFKHLRQHAALYNAHYLVSSVRRNYFNIDKDGLFKWDYTHSKFPLKNIIIIQAQTANPTYIYHERKAWSCNSTESLSLQTVVQLAFLCDYFKSKYLKMATFLDMLFTCTDSTF